jgi:ABC-type glycerol-3-phosphate transport system permease component
MLRSLAALRMSSTRGWSFGASRRKGIGRRFSTTGLIVLFCAVAIVPFLYVVSASFTERRALVEFPPEWIPSHPTVVNFEHLLGDHPFTRWTLNTLLVSSTVAVAKVFMDSMAGYSLSKLDFPGKRIISGAMLVTVMIPVAVLIIPLFFMLRDLHILDTYWALLLPPLANPIGVFMMRGYIDALPRDLESAAAIDGAGPLRTYWFVVLPLVRPGLVVIGIYTFLLQYTNFVLPLIGTDSEDLRVLTTGVASLYSPVGTDYGLVSAGAVAAMVPITIVFFILQRQFMAASLAGALKE